ncbi:TlpA family protein disulfide reductase [Allopusillimonas ginsengisoli]|uniref:TlpA family protein disulfide reductase n=1 Tax=Allopusillimonas ginsengisoli TaxID=453575 RepID=UPI0039C4B012
MFAQPLRLSFIAAVSLLLMAGCKPADNSKSSAATKILEIDQMAQPAAPSLPDLQVLTLEERPAQLSSYVGMPVVLNLWATWCPPCRREMPVLEQAQTAFPDVAFVLVNQGESAQVAKEFLEVEGLNLTDVLLDPDSKTMHEMRTGGLPTTFFVDARGRMVDLHLGEITMADLEGKISSHFSD